MSTAALRFAELFAGRDDAYGLGKGGVRHELVTPAVYQDHLFGRAPIGIFPLLDDGTVRFAAIDLDEPDFELARTMQRMIPGSSWVERSRSGNAHVWVFFAAPAPAWAARAVLRGATQSVGRPDVEIFPKQDRVRVGGVGNYINLPYHGDDRPILADGMKPGPAPEAVTVELDAAEFLSRAEATLQDPADWERRARRLGATPPEEREESSTFGEQPNLHECAERIILNKDSNPLKPGHRHEVLFHLSCMILNWREVDADEARGLVDEVNAAALRPLARHEVDRLFLNALEGRYTFTGCDQPVMQPYVSPTCPIASGAVGR